jgi:predicted RNA-binding protein with RPS1 domain
MDILKLGRSNCQIADAYVYDLNDFVTEGDELRTVITEYDDRRLKWSLRKIQE